MGLMIFRLLAGCHPWNHGAAISRPGAPPHRGMGELASASVALMFLVITSIPVKAQQAAHPGCVPRKAEKRFGEPQSGQTPSGRSAALRVPNVSRPEAIADSGP